MFVTKINPETKLQEIQFSAKLIQLSEKVLQLKNEKRTNYKVATIEFENEQKQMVRRTAFCYEGNYQHGMEVGQTYLCKSIFTPDFVDENGNKGNGVLVTVSHLNSTGARPDADDFGFKATSAVRVLATQTSPEEVKETETVK